MQRSHERDEESRVKTSIVVLNAVLSILRSELLEAMSNRFASFDKKYCRPVITCGASLERMNKPVIADSRVVLSMSASSLRFDNCLKAVLSTISRKDFVFACK